MKKSIILIMTIAISSATKAFAQVSADDALQMLADFTPYLCNQYQPIEQANSKGERIATFKGENTFGNNEQGVRHNADLSMVCAFLCKYGKDKVMLPDSITWEQLAEMARTTLVYAYSTHKANKLFPCKGGQYWGSVSRSNNSWESSLWAMSVAYSAFFQWNELTKQQQSYIYEMLKAECNYELERDIPTGFKGDTKAEENGWECDILAVTLGLFPNDKLAPKWFDRLREFAINCYSHPDDKDDQTIIDPEYDNTTVASLYKGANLYEDYSLQNHNYFHTSYQNVVVQELGEAALALKLFQKELYGNERWKTNALMHNNQKVMDNILYPLALPDGELAMPNGNDWSLFLYDQVTSYSTMACFLRDSKSLMLEQLALEQIKKRQKTTSDGSWLLRADVGARRMGVEAHRVMMTWLMHHILPTTDIQPTTWEDFSNQFAKTKPIDEQDVVTASTSNRFVCFSWSKGLRNTTGYFAPINKLENNIIVPFKANGTGNFIGWYEVEGKRTDAVDISHHAEPIGDNGFIINGQLATNERTLLNDYYIIATPGNAIIYIDNVVASADCRITKERGGLLAISVDPFTSEKREICYNTFSTTTLNGDYLFRMKAPWVNIDNCIGIVSANADGMMAFGDKRNNNSINTAKLYASYSDQARDMKANENVGSRFIVYYSNVSSTQTQELSKQMKAVAKLPNGWNGMEVMDTDGSKYLILYSFNHSESNEINIDKVRNKVKADHVIVATRLEYH